MYKKRSVRKKVIFMAIIISMSILGVGYASWNDTTTMELSMKTGFIKQCLEVIGKPEIREGEEIYLPISLDGSVLSISGNIYPDFNGDILISIDDIGTVLSTITDIPTGTNGSATLIKLDTSNNKKQLFKININATSNSNNNNKELNATDSSTVSKISTSEHNTDIIEEKMYLYNEGGNCEFNYIFTYKLGGWEKKIVHRW